MPRFTRHGFWEIVIGTLLLMLVATGLALVHWSLALLVLPALLWLWAFFRDPEREIPVDPTIMVSPADGLVSDVTQMPHHDLLGGPCVRIGIFLSVFNVHVNRSPCGGRVTAVTYKKGKFVNALRHDEASDQNESNTLTLSEINDDTPGGGRPIAVVKQIVGLIARRIICDKRPGDAVVIGERFGMIKFGSRTELYIPLWLNPTVQVKVGQKVRGAADIIATLVPPTPGAATPCQSGVAARAPADPAETRAQGLASAPASAMPAVEMPAEDAPPPSPGTQAVSSAAQPASHDTSPAPSGASAAPNGASSAPPEAHPIPDDVQSGATPTAPAGMRA